MTSGFRSYFSRRRFMVSHCERASAYGFHCRGLEENTWNALHPRRYARSAASSTPPAVETWMPMRRDVRQGGDAGAGCLRMSLCSWAMVRLLAVGIWLLAISF